jgi:hypothetical protein
MEASRQLAEGVSSTLSDTEKQAANKSAAEVLAGLRQLCATAESHEDVAVYLAHTIARMLATFQSNPLQTAGDLIDHHMIAYSLAAGGLAGVYPLPEGDEPAPEQKYAAPLRVVPRDEQIGQYL